MKESPCLSRYHHAVGYTYKQNQSSHESTPVVIDKGSEASSDKDGESPEEMSELRDEQHVLACKEGPSFVASLLTVISMFLICVTFPISLCWVIKVVQVG